MTLVARFRVTCEGDRRLMAQGVKASYRTMEREDD